MLDLWFSEFHAPDAKLSILVKEQLYSEQTPFQKIDFLIRKPLVNFYFRRADYDYRKGRIYLS